MPSDRADQYSTNYDISEEYREVEGKISGGPRDTVNSDIPVPWGRGQSQTH